MMIMFLVHVCTAVSAMVAVLGVLLTVVDRNHTLHADALVKRGGGKGITGLINSLINQMVMTMVQGMWRRSAAGGYQPIPATACDAR